MNIIFLLVTLIFVLAITMASFFAYLAKKYRANRVQAQMDEIDAASQYRRQHHHKPKSHKDYRAKDKILEEKKVKELQEAQEMGVVRYDPLGREPTHREPEKTEIIGLAKPVGFWSKFIMNQKLGFILARMSLQHNNKNGYWVNTIKAQASSHGKNQGKGR
jgi:hypothetical protein